MMMIRPSRMRFLPTPSARRATRDGSGGIHPISGFLPTPSARRATRSTCWDCDITVISTHALREEGDALT